MPLCAAGEAHQSGSRMRRPRVRDECPRCGTVCERENSHEYRDGQNVRRSWMDYMVEPRTQARTAARDITHHNQGMP